jgi:hypothetical protein
MVIEAAKVDPMPSTAMSKPTPSQTLVAFLLRGARPAGPFKLSIDICFSFS